MAYDLNKIYKLDPYNWYKIYPYGFVYNGTDAKPLKMWLPINPSNIQVTTHFATNIITTLYGVVEEHSEVRYYDITIQGTTGFAPKNYKPEDYTARSFMGKAAAAKGDDEVTIATGRESFTYNPLVSIGGFFQKQLGVFNQVKEGISQITGATDDVTGVQPIQTGYTAFHNLYRLFLTYKKDMAANASTTKKPSFRFLNYKDGVQYDVAPRTFTLTRSAESPMLYNYTIVLRAYNLDNVDAKKAPTEQDKLSELGLDGIGGSAFSKMKNFASNAKTIVGGALSALPR
jgi:hypothetical protein